MLEKIKYYELQWLICVHLVNFFLDSKVAIQKIFASSANGITETKRMTDLENSGLEMMDVV